MGREHVRTGKPGKFAPGAFSPHGLPTPFLPAAWKGRKLRNGFPTTGNQHRPAVPPDLLNDGGAAGFELEGADGSVG